MVVRKNFRAMNPVLVPGTNNIALTIESTPVMIAVNQ